MTMGDPGGIGPQLLVRVLAVAQARGSPWTPVVFGDAATLRAAAQLEEVAMEVAQVDSLEPGREAEAAWQAGRIPVVELPELVGSEFERGRVAARNGRAAVAWIERAVEACRRGQADALVTAPIAKEAIQAAGSPFPGHTEMLAALCGGCDVRMMLVGGGLRVVLETIHVALREVPRLLTPAHIVQTLTLVEEWSQKYLRRRGRIGVCGLNPHAGEGGLFGNEEIETIEPAVKEARVRGIDVRGPLPADTIFHRARLGEFDFVLAMYHDQGLVALKTVAFDVGVNVTLGLPFVRTSPDHGTAFDRAWRRGVALSTRSMEHAIAKAARWARLQRRCSKSA